MGLRILRGFPNQFLTDLYCLIESPTTDIPINVIPVRLLARVGFLKSFLFPMFHQDAKNDPSSNKNGHKNGAVLQPVLYSAAVEQGLGKKVVTGRLYYCTTAGGFAEHPIPINDYNRNQGLHRSE